MTQLQPWLVPVILVAGWLLVSTLFSFLSGWPALARRFRAASRPSGTRLTRHVARMGQAHENGITGLVVSDSGLYLWTAWPFRLLRPPLLIPWSAIHGARERPMLWWTSYEIDLAGVTWIRITPRAYEVIRPFLERAAPSSAWPLRPQVEGRASRWWLVPAFAAAYLVLATAAWLGLGRLSLVPARGLADKGVMVEAIVTALDCGNHGTVRYSFMAGGRPFDGVGQPGEGNRPCEDLRVGDSLSVWYRPAAPELNSPGDPQVRLRNEQVSVALVAFLLPALLLGSLAWTARRFGHDPG